MKVRFSVAQTFIENFTIECESGSTEHLKQQGVKHFNKHYNVHSEETIPAETNVQILCDECEEAVSAFNMRHYNLRMVCRHCYENLCNGCSSEKDDFAQSMATYIIDLMTTYNSALVSGRRDRLDAAEEALFAGFRALDVFKIPYETEQAPGTLVYSHINLNGNIYPIK